MKKDGPLANQTDSRFLTRQNAAGFGMTTFGEWLRGDQDLESTHNPSCFGIREPIREQTNSRTIQSARDEISWGS